MRVERIADGIEGMHVPRVANTPCALRSCRSVTGGEHVSRTTHHLVVHPPIFSLSPSSMSLTIPAAINGHLPGRMGHSRTVSLMSSGGACNPRCQALSLPISLPVSTHGFRRLAQAPTSRSTRGAAPRRGCPVPRSESCASEISSLDHGTRVQVDSPGS